MDMQTLMYVMQMVLTFGNLCIMLYAFRAFLNKPHTTMDAKIEELKKRVDEHDVKFKEVAEALHQGNDQFRKQHDINEVFINCMLAFIDFEMAYCTATEYKDTEDLEEAKSTLRKYLAKK